MIKEYWNEVYSMKPVIKDDEWLDKYKFLLKNCATILDLGCGTGINERYLEKINVFPKVCDLSINAIKIMKELYPRCEAKVADISEKLPYEDGQIDLIIADLTLHYFDYETTLGVVEELRRILNCNGIVIGRVNAVKGVNKGEFLEVEENYYEENGCFRRYFSREDIERFFKGFKILVNKEDITDKYGHKKYVIEFLLQKN